MKKNKNQKFTPLKLQWFVKLIRMTIGRARLASTSLLKRKSTPRVLTGFTKLLLAIFLGSVFLSSSRVYALPSLDQQINEIEQRIEENKAAVSQKQSEASDLQSQVKIMDQGIAATQGNINSLSSEISNKEKEIQRLTGEIKANEERILNNKEDLKSLVKLLYEKGNLTTIEVLASTQSITGFLNQEEYNRAIQEKINSTITEIKVLKAQLEQQKKDQESKKLALQSQKDALEKERKNQQYQKSIKDDLLSQTKGEQANYEKLLKENTHIAQELYEERQRLSRGNNEQGWRGSSSYPWSGRGIDPWGFYKLQCTSYAAWKWNSVYGKRWVRPSNVSTGNAWNWPELARKQPDGSYSVSYSPRVGSIMVWGISASTPYGHVAIVEKVNSNGTVKVSEYNYWYPERYGERDGVSASGHQFIY